MTRKGPGDMTAKEMGKKGGTTTKTRHGHEFYVSIGKKGGSRIKHLIALGKTIENKGEPQAQPSEQPDS